MASWSSKQTSVLHDIGDAEQFFPLIVDLGPQERAAIQVQVEESASSVDVTIYTTLDASSEVWDTQSALGFGVFGVEPGSPSPQARSLIVSGYYRLRFGIKRSSGIDTVGTVTLTVRIA